jgi:hypothetical protein
MGGFSCKTHPRFGMNVDSAFGPHGGTVRLINEVDMTRIDVEEVTPMIDIKTMTDMQLVAVYENHLTHVILPLVRQNMQDAKMLWKKKYGA